jgi:hypothetical protein
MRPLRRTETETDCDQLWLSRCVLKCSLSKYGFRVSGVRTGASVHRPETGHFSRLLTSVLNRPSQQAQREPAVGERFLSFSRLSRSIGPSQKPTPARKKSEGMFINSPPPPVFRCAGGGGRPRPPAPARSPTAPIIPARGCLRPTVRLLPYPPSSLRARRPAWLSAGRSHHGVVLAVSPAPSLGACT